MAVLVASRAARASWPGTGRPREPGSLERTSPTAAPSWSCSPASACCWWPPRASPSAALRSMRRRGSRTFSRILVVGAGAIGREITERLVAHRELGFEVVGFLDDDPGLACSSFFGVPVVGTRAPTLPRSSSGRTIDQLMIALPLDAHKQDPAAARPDVSSECVEIRWSPTCCSTPPCARSLEDLDGIPMINLSQVPLQGWQQPAKRGIDLLIVGDRHPLPAALPALSSRSPSGWRTGARLLHARSAWGSTGGRSGSSSSAR
jgi:hypothetical protein